METDEIAGGIGHTMRAPTHTSAGTAAVLRVVRRTGVIRIWSPVSTALLRLRGSRQVGLA